MKGNFVAKHMHKMNRATIEENKKQKASIKPSKEDLEEIKQKELKNDREQHSGFFDI